MLPSDQLFRLIKSLDPSEKGYFKKFAKSYGKSQNYLLLFDAIDAQEAYDEASLVKKFRKESFAKQFSVAKSYLWDLILRSQRQYRAESSKFIQLNTLMENGEILFEKGLYEEGMRSWDKAAKLAETFDEKPFMLDIETARRRYYIDYTAGNWQEQTVPSFQHSRELINAYAQMLHIQEKYVTIVQFIKSQPYFRTDEQKNDWVVFMQDPELHPSKEPTSFYGRLYFYYIHNIFHLLDRNKEEALPWIRKVVDLWEENKALKELEPLKYISAVFNYMINLLYLKETDAFCNFFERFEPPAVQSIAKNAVVFEHVWLMRANYHLLKKDIAGSGQHIEETASQLEKYAPYINKVRIMIIRFTMASYYTLQGRVEKSNALLSQIVGSKEVELRKDVQSMARVLQMANHYEAGNLMLMEHLIRSAKHFMQQHDMYYDTEKCFFKHFGQLVKAADKPQKRKILQTMYDEISSLFATNEAERTAFESMYLCEWILRQLQKLA